MGLAMDKCITIHFGGSEIVLYLQNDVLISSDVVKALGINKHEMLFSEKHFEHRDKRQILFSVFLSTMFPGKLH